MFSTWWPRRLKTKSAFSRRQGGGARRRSTFQPRLEILEERVVLATAIWTSHPFNPFANDLWSNGANWLGGHAPQDFDDVLFPTFPRNTRRTPVNDIIDLNVRSITVAETYHISGNRINLGAGGISVPEIPFPEIDEVQLNLDIRLIGGLTATPITLGSDGALIIGGVISGFGPLEITDNTNNRGPVLTGANTYDGITTVARGILNVGHPSALGATGAGNKTVVLNGASLHLLDNSSANESLELGGTLLDVSSNDLTWGGPINLTSEEAVVDVFNVTRLTLSGPIGGDGGLEKLGPGKLILSGDNSYEDETRVSEGSLRIRHPRALGSRDRATNVVTGATLELDGNFTVDGERLTLVGTGVGNSGALLNAGGFNVWTGNVQVIGPSTLNVASGQLTLSGVISGFASLEKLGAGTLALAGDSANFFSGSLTVRAGLLDLGKVSGNSVNGPLIIGDGVGGADADQVRLLRSNQILDTAPVTINPTGLLNLNTRNETIGPLTMTGGRVSTGTGILSPFGNVTATTAHNVTAALIEGNLSLGPVSRTFTIPDGPAAVDLLISAKIAGTASGAGLIKAGTGTLRLTSNSSNYTGPTTITGGRLVVDGTQPTSAVVVNAGSTLAGDGTVGPLTVRGTLDPGFGATLDVSGPVFFGLPFVRGFGTFVARPGTGGFSATGSVALNGATLQVAPALPPLNAPIPIIVGNTISGTFRNAANGAILPVAFPTGTILFRITYTPNVVFLTRISGPAFQNRAVTSPTNEGGLATLTGTITTPDPGDTFFLEVNWGDGSRTETHRFGPFAPRTVSLTHRYRDDNPSGTPSDNYTIGLLWRDQRGAQNTGTLVATVNNVPPAVNAGPAAVVLQNTILARPVSFADPGADTWAATVDYGDGSGVQPLAIGAATRFTLLWHRYDTPGTYTARVTVTDDDGGTGTDSFVVTVRPWWPFLGIGAQLPLSAEDIADDGLGVASALVPEPGQSASGLHPLEGNRIDLDRAALDRFFQLAAENTPRSRAIRVQADSLADGLDDDLLEALITGFPSENR